tara:strand:+ start:83 stop:952 length:870 start_codon:yes stop_codon:yes gene_type:complete
MSTLTLDRRIVWFDNTNIDYKNVDKSLEFLTVSEKEKPFVSDSFPNIKITLTVGSLDSKTGNNQLLNSSFYDSDEVVKSHKITAFSDSSDYHGRKISVPFNPKKLQRTYGQFNPEPIFQDILDEPFDDVKDMNDALSYIELDEESKYPVYYNTFFLSGFNGNISVFETIEHIDGRLLTESPIKGLKANLETKGRDSRNRSINIIDRISIQDINSNRTIEPFSDERSNDVLLNNLIYYTENDSDVRPFNDNRKINFTTLNFSPDDIFSSAGYDYDMTLGGKPDSITYRES